MPETDLRRSTALFQFPFDNSIDTMLGWLGEDYPAEIACILQDGFEKQQPGSQLQAVQCLERPEFLTTAAADGKVKAMQATFKLKALVTTQDGLSWWLYLKAVLTGLDLFGNALPKVVSDVEVEGSEILAPAGRDLFEELKIGVRCERSGELLEWGALLEEFLALSDPDVEQDGETFYLTWRDESILSGLSGDLLASFTIDRPELSYLSLSPESTPFFGAAEDGLLPEWQHLTALFGPPTEVRFGEGFRWELGPLDLLLLYRSCNEFHYAEDYHKWLAIHWVGEG